AADVSASVAAARANDLPLAVRGGGHSLHGYGVCDGGLVVDLTDLRGIHVDTNRLIVTAQAGSTWRDVDHKTQAFGLATTGAHISLVGIGGSTLGGGCGWVVGRHRRAVDKLPSAGGGPAEGAVITARGGEQPRHHQVRPGGGGRW